jgi:hypothetical protein
MILLRLLLGCLFALLSCFLHRGEVAILDDQWHQVVVEEEEVKFLPKSKFASFFLVQKAHGGFEHIQRSDLIFREEFPLRQFLLATELYNPANSLHII